VDMRESSRWAGVPTLQNGKVIWFPAKLYQRLGELIFVKTIRIFAARPGAVRRILAARSLSMSILMRPRNEEQQRGADQLP
jgi:hypothetical protein